MRKDMRSKQYIVVLGGGTGQFNLLRGLVQLNSPELITAIPGTWDSGGSSGRLRTELGILPPGDARRCLLALMEDDLQREIAIQLFDDRLEGFEGMLQGHSVGNLIIACLDRANQGHDKGLDAARRLFRVRGNIVPVSLNNLRLIAKLQSGIELDGEAEIDHRWQRDDFNPADKISSIFFTTQAKVNPQAIAAILSADKIVLSMGSLVGSILPHLCVPGIREAILKSRAKLIYIQNIMTERGQTDAFLKASDHLKMIVRYLGDTKRIDYMLSESDKLTKEILDVYKQEGQFQVEIDKKDCQKLLPNLKVIEKKIAGYSLNDHLIRHDPIKLGKLILSI